MEQNFLERYLKKLGTSSNSKYDFILGENYDVLKFEEFPKEYQDVEFQKKIEGFLYNEMEDTSREYKQKSPFLLEEFREIPGFSKYLISTYGRVYSKFKQKILSVCKNQDGYLTVNIKKDFGIHIKKSIHSLMKLVFFGDTKFEMINHIDELRYNNCIWNIHPCNIRYNNNFGTRTYRCAQSNINGGSAKANNTKANRTFSQKEETLRKYQNTLKLQNRLIGVKSIKLDSGEERIFICAGEAARELFGDTKYNTARKAIRSCCKKLQDTYKGYIFQFI